MPDTNNPFDEYTFRARLIPVLWVYVIPVMGFLCWLPAFSPAQLALAALLPVVITAMFSQLGRDQGKALEPKLFADWGGQPSVQLLRYRDGREPKDALARYRSKLQTINPNIQWPTELEELADPNEADRRYFSICLFLRETTRNKSTFPVLFNENVNYGCRRNLLGMRSSGILLSLLGTLSSVLAMIVGMKEDSFDVPAVPLVVTILNAFLFSWWCLRINSEWVRVAAFAYAERLVGSCDSLPVSPKPSSSETTKE